MLIRWRSWCVQWRILPIQAYRRCWCGTATIPTYLHQRHLVQARVPRLQAAPLQSVLALALMSRGCLIVGLLLKWLPISRMIKLSSLGPEASVQEQLPVSPQSVCLVLLHSLGYLSVRRYCNRQGKLLHDVYWKTFHQELMFNITDLDLLHLYTAHSAQFY